MSPEKQPAPAMQEQSSLKDIQTKLLARFLNSEDSTGLDQVVSSLRMTAEAEKLGREAEKLRVEAENLVRTSRADAKRFQLTILAPLITAVAVAAGLGLQAFQINQNIAQQRGANEATRFKDAVTLASSQDPLQSVAGAVLLKQFTEQGSYTEQARQISVGVISHSLSTDSFNLFFSSVKEKTNLQNYRDVVQVSQNLRDSYFEEAKTLDELKAQQTVNKKQTGVPEQLKRQQRVVDQIGYQRDKVSEFLASIIRTRKPDESLDYTGVNIWDANLSNVQFHKVDLKNASIGYTDVEDADLSEVTSFSESDWQFTAWWRARKINPSLLADLIERFPIHLQTDKNNSAPPYKVSGPTPSASEYCRALVKLGYKEKTSTCNN